MTLVCPNCNSTKLVKDGKCLKYNPAKGIAKKIQRYLCTNCDKTTSKPNELVSGSNPKTKKDGE